IQMSSSRTEMASGKKSPRFTDFGKMSPGCNQRGKCGERRTALKPDFPVPCFSETPAFLVEDETYAKIEEACGDVLDEFIVGEREFCCDKAKADLLVDQLTAASLLFGRCKACYRNFRIMACHQVCSSRQIHFIKITNTTLSETPDPEFGDQMVVNAHVFLTEDMAVGVVESCLNVPFFNTDAISNLCSGNGAETCDYLCYFWNFGDIDAGNVPFNFDYKVGLLW
ncbi:unnamed protein product, partial [Cyprideis torosa]